jgi:hypothetical protein
MMTAWDLQNRRAAQTFGASGRETLVFENTLMASGGRRAMAVLGPVAQLSDSAIQVTLKTVTILNDDRVVGDQRRQCCGSPVGSLCRQ